MCVCGKGALTNNEPDKCVCTITREQYALTPWWRGGGVGVGVGASVGIGASARDAASLFVFVFVFVFLWVFLEGG